MVTCVREACRKNTFACHPVSYSCFYVYGNVNVLGHDIYPLHQIQEIRLTLVSRESEKSPQLAT